MYIAQQLRKENIGEYILYMWQIEDLIRAFQLDIDKIEKNIVQPYDLSIVDKKKLHQWYQSLIEMMRVEKIIKKGHLQINKNTIEKLNEYHEQLYHSTDQISPSYQSLFLSIRPLIFDLRKQIPQQIEMNDIEVCLSFLYGILLLKMKKANISTETQQAQQQISKFVQLLSSFFLQKEQEDTQ